MNTEQIVPDRAIEPGTGIKLINLSSRTNQRSITSDLALRYIFSPAEEILLLGLMGHKSLSVTKLLRARLSLLQPLPYIDRDNSDAAMLVATKVDPRRDPEDMAGKAEYLKTPFAQALQLMETYGANGIRVIDSLTGVNPDVATLIEYTILPAIPERLSDLISDLRNFGMKRIAESPYLEPQTQKLAQKVLDEMLSACLLSENYIKVYVRNTKSEIAARQVPGGRGKPEWDDYDDRLGFQVNLRPPTDEELRTASEKRQIDSNQNLTNALVSAIKQAQNPGQMFNTDQVRAFEEMQKKVDLLSKVLQSHPELVGELELTEDIQKTDSNSDTSEEIIIEDLPDDSPLLNFKPLANEPITDESAETDYKPLITKSTKVAETTQPDISQRGISEKESVKNVIGRKKR